MVWFKFQLGWRVKLWWNQLPQVDSLDGQNIQVWFGPFLLREDKLVRYDLEIHFEKQISSKGLVGRDPQGNVHSRSKTYNNETKTYGIEEHMPEGGNLIRKNSR